MAGKNFCVSFANAADADWCLTHGQSVMWDNGAFTHFKSGKAFDPDAFARWVEPRLGHPHWAVIPDQIGGGVQVQRELIKSWPHPPGLSAPVWHMGQPLDWLSELLESFPKICFGSSGDFWQVGSDRWARRADEAWNLIERSGARPWIHMLRGLSLCGDIWPFASADSTNVAINFKGSKSRDIAYKCPERMARVIDARQNPVSWGIKSEQMSLL